MNKQQRKAMELALEALEEIALAGMSGSGQESEEGMIYWHARQAWKFIGIAARALEPIEEALAQSEQEPVAITTGVYGGRFTYVTNKPHVILPNGIGLYAAPQRKPLTDSDYVSACVSYRHDFGLMTQEQREKLMFQAREWARAFGMSEAAHGIKE